MMMLMSRQVQGMAHGAMTSFVTHLERERLVMLKAEGWTLVPTWKVSTMLLFTLAVSLITSHFTDSTVVLRKTKK